MLYIRLKFIITKTKLLDPNFYNNFTFECLGNLKVVIFNKPLSDCAYGVVTLGYVKIRTCLV